MKIARSHIILEVHPWPRFCWITPACDLDKHNPIGRSLAQTKHRVARLPIVEADLVQHIFAASKESPTVHVKEQRLPLWVRLKQENSSRGSKLTNYVASGSGRAIRPSTSLALEFLRQHLRASSPPTTYRRVISMKPNTRRK